MTKAQRWAAFYERAERYGFTPDEADRLRRIEMTLHRWSELECGDGNNHASWAVERDEATGKPYLVTYPHTGKPHRRRIPDRERGALSRLKCIIAGHNGPGLPKLTFYHQTDPRGCALYILRAGDVPEGRPPDSCYTNGWAVSV